MSLNMEMNEDQNVINRVFEGDINAFGVLVERYQRPVYNLVYRLVGSANEAAEFTQETFIKAYENLAQFQKDRRFFPWICAIGLNVARDHLRRKKFDVEINAGSDLERFQDCSNPDYETNRLCEGLEFLRVEKALKDLPLKLREALILRYHEELPIQEIADILRISLSATKMRICRGLEVLRRNIRREA
jgi:RNA polymerase sigma-70 factor (ECF subfamily)